MVETDAVFFPEYLLQLVFSFDAEVFLSLSFDNYKTAAKLAFETNKPNSALKISSQSPKEISVDQRLADFLGIGRTSRKEEYVKKLNSSSCLFIYCDLIESRKNFFNGKKSTLLAKVDVRRKP